MNKYSVMPSKFLLFGVMICMSFMAVAIENTAQEAAKNVASNDQGLAVLEQFLRSTKSGLASFTQTVTAPANKDSSSAAVSPAKSKISSGTFEFARPSRFRFDYIKPYPQSIIADGKTLWFYDPDLQQVTRTPQAAALQTTPVALIATADSVGTLRSQFVLTSVLANEMPGELRSLTWIQATPRKMEGTIAYLRVGFMVSPAGVQLRALEIMDSLGQHSLLQLTQLRSNYHPSASNFEFTVPAGVTVSGQ